MATIWKIYLFVFCNLALLSQRNEAYATETLETESHLKLLKFLESRDFNTRFFKKLHTTDLRLNNTFGQGFLDNVTNMTVSDMQCASQLQAVINGIQNSEMWAIKMLDSWGKIPSGILLGHLIEMGNYDECINLEHTLASNSTLRGKYCMSNLPLGLVLKNTTFGNMLNIRIGICIPAACNADTIDVLLKKVLSSVLQVDENIFENEVLLEDRICKISHKDDKFETIDWVAIIIMGALGICMVLSTCYDYVVTLKEKPLHPLLSAFSVRNNLHQLLKVTSPRNSPHVVHCLHGIRCLSLVWVIYGHCFMLMLLMKHINTIDVLEWSRAPFSMFILSATISVDSFFFLSGLLLIMVSLRKMTRINGKINILLMWIHRYLRLTPVLALAILFFVSIFRYMGNGPLWDGAIVSYKACYKTWWVALLYVQNYVENNKMCLGHSWYLAVDTQLYFISPFILIAVWKWKKKALAALATLGLLLLACMIMTIVENKLVVFTNGNTVPDAGKMMMTIYYPTHTRALPWIIGFIFGYFLHSFGGRRIQLSKTTVVLGWLCSLTFIFTTIFVLYPKTLAGATPLTPVESAFYWSLVRIAWPLGLAWIVFACVHDYAGPVNQFLSWSFWQPMSKLSYCMYISHLLVQINNAGRIKTNTYFSDYQTILRFWGDFGITILVSLLMYLAIEAPMAGIEQFLFFKNPTKPNSAEPVEPSTSSQQRLCD